MSRRNSARSSFTSCPSFISVTSTRLNAANTGEVLGAFKRVLVTEMNDGQLVKLLRGEFRRDIESYAVTQGRPLLAAELEAQMLERL